ncbi:Fur-regulated basic protein FbpA [Halobacillus halophilus]|uniref:Fur-regulated basic protein FbpA n=1 Tax=Halobacillus halophilus TaxID=1570 RepID=UPI001CD716F8|nr:Fur-regulated basic protein FbpA [Halobacillus halophilus]MCA1011944.1 Fur-regulated basic protein FbpA [Halobacillus halophilus]
MSRLRDAVIQRRNFLICQLIQTRNYKNKRKNLVNMPLENLESEYDLLKDKIG